MQLKWETDQGALTVTVTTDQAGICGCGEGEGAFTSSTV